MMTIQIRARSCALPLLIAFAIAACQSEQSPGPGEPGAAATSTADTYAVAVVSSAAEAVPNGVPGFAGPIDVDTPLTAEGWGPLKIGMTRDEVVALAGEDANPDAVGGPDPARCDEFRPSGAPPGLLVMIQNGRLTRISLGSGSRVPTDRGIRVGDEADAVKTTYGASLVSTPHAYVAPPGAYLTIEAAPASGGEARGVVYEVGPEGRISRIHAGGPSIHNVEGCL